MTENINPNTNQNNNEENISDNLREAGDALKAAGSALGAAFGKAIDGLRNRVETNDTTNDTQKATTTEDPARDIRTLANNLTAEAERIFNDLRERDLKFTEDTKATVRSKLAEMRTAIDERSEKAETPDERNALDDLRTRFEGFVDRVQSQFKAAEKEAEKEAQKREDIIEGEVVQGDADTVLRSYRNTVTDQNPDITDRK